MTRLQQAAIRLYEATQADRKRSREMSAFQCARLNPEMFAQSRPCWKAEWDKGYDCWTWPSAGGDEEGSSDPVTWCEPCQERQKLYLDKSAKKELGNAKRSFWAAVRALLKEKR